MFENWNPRFDPPTHRVVDPTVPVTVDLGMAFPRTPRSRTDGLALKIRAEGVVLSGSADALLHAWLRTETGDWVGWISLTARSGNSRHTVTLRQWVPSAAITPRASSDRAYRTT